LSVRHIGLVLDHLEAPPPVKLVALILADHADSDGVCWPSYGRLAERSCMSERTVRRHVAELCSLGVVRKLRTGGVVSDGGRRAYVSNRYRIDADVLAAMPALCKVVTDDHLEEPTKVVTDDHLDAEGGQEWPPKVVRSGHPRWSPVTTKPSVEQPSEGTVTLKDPAPLDVGPSRSELERDFEEWWEASGRLGSKADALGLYRWWRTTGGAGADELLAAVANYRAHCAATDCFQQHGRTFLVKPTKNQAARWPEWASGEEHGSSDVAGAGRLGDILQVGREWIEGGSDEGHRIDAGGRRCIESGRRDEDPAEREDAGGGLPALRLASRE